MREMIFAVLLLLGLTTPAVSEEKFQEPFKVPEKLLFKPLSQAHLRLYMLGSPVVIDARMPNERVGEFAKYSLGCTKDRCRKVYSMPYDQHFGVAEEDVRHFRCQPGVPVLVICLAGVRSAHLANELHKRLVNTGQCQPGQITSLTGGLFEKYRLEQEKKLVKQ